MDFIDRETTRLPATHGLPESSSPTWERKLGSVPNADLIVNSPPFPPLLPPPNSGPLDLGSPLSSIFFFSVCDSRNLNLSPFCNLTSYSQMAKWQPAINSTYGSAMADYTRKLQGPLRLKYPGQGKAGADRELLTSLKQVLIPNPSQIDQEAEFNMIDFTGEPILQRLRKGYCCGEHILWRSNCVWWGFCKFILIHNNY